MDDYWLTDTPTATINLQHLPLKAMHLLTNVYRPQLICTVAPGVRRVALGHEDVFPALEQPALAQTVEDLVLDLAHMAPPDFEDAWPEALALPRLKSVRVHNCQSVVLAARLGQRCAGVALSIYPGQHGQPGQPGQPGHHRVHDIEEDYEAVRAP